MRECLYRNFVEHPNRDLDDDVESQGSDCSDGVEENSEKINKDAKFNRENPSGSSASAKEVVDSGQSKLCVRGHWRPAEDSKLKELVALYGPQNWNLIAEKMEGRSGGKTSVINLIMPPLFLLKELYFFYFSLLVWCPFYE